MAMKIETGRISFEWKPTLHDMLKKRGPLIQSDAKPNYAIMIPLHSLTRALRQLHVISLSFDWFTALSVSFVIG